DLALAEAERSEEVKGRRGEVLRWYAELVAAEILTQRPLVEDELDVEGRRQCLLYFSDCFFGEAFRHQRGVVDGRRLRERPMADRVSLDLGDIGFAVSERAQCFGHRTVDDLEVTAAGELLELHQREVRLDAGGVTIHHQSDGAGRCNHGRLRIAV